MLKIFQVKFNWGTGAITPYGRDYVSARWHGKLLAPSTEAFTLYVKADDAARLYVDHVLVIDAWEGGVDELSNHVNAINQRHLARAQVSRRRHSSCEIWRSSRGDV